MLSEIKVPNEYSCPICSSKPNDNFFFYEHILIGEPICEDCNADFGYWVETEKVDDKFIESVEKHPDLSWRNCRQILLKQRINELKKFEVDGFENWFRSTQEDCRWTREEALESVRRKVAWLEERLKKIRS